MTTRRVYVIWSHPLFLDALRMLLKHPEIEVIGDHAENPAILEKLDKLQADVVVVEDDAPEHARRALAMLEMSRRNLRIIRLNLQDNRMGVYAAELGMLEHADELLNIILEKEMLWQKKAR